MRTTHSTVALITLALLSACTSAGSYKGQLEAQLGATFPEDLRVIARAEAGVTDMTCLSFEATPDAAGAFQLSGLCPEVTYTLKLNDKNLLVEGSNEIQGASAETPPTLLRVWPVSAGSGVALLSEGKLKSLATYTDVKKLQLLGTQEDVLYPRHKPNSSAVVPDSGYLVITGSETLTRLQFHPRLP
jgi:hypothetical protein